MLLNPNDPLFNRVPVGFESPFPSLQGLASPKLQALLKKPLFSDSADKLVTIGQAYLSQAGAQAWNAATGILWKLKATQVGDIASDLMPKLMWLNKTGIPQGIIAEVPFLLSTEPKVQLAALGRVGMELALAAASAVPIAGRILNLVVGVAQVVMEIFRANTDEVAFDTTLRLPWDEYNRDADESIVNALLTQQVPLPDWTDVFAPPTERKGWRVAEGLNAEGRELGTVFAPPRIGEVPTRGEVAYTSALGVIPGTFRVAGVLQSQHTPQPTQDLLRFYSDGQLIARGDQLTQTGDWFPSLQQVGGMLWEQAMCFGRPDAFKIDTIRLAKEWVEWFSYLYDSAFEVGRPDFLLPYLAHEVHGEQVIGVDAGGILRPATEDGELVPLVTPGIWTQGIATPATRTTCWFTESSRAPIEQLSLPTHYERDEWGNPVAPKPPKAQYGRRCIPWPPGHLLLAKYSRVDTAIVVPALQALAQVQRDSLARSLVCAYVRPDDIEGLPRYAAFADEDLRARCIELRKVLLKHPSRMLVDYDTARIVDPKFAELLRDVGVPTTRAQRAAAIKQLAGNREVQRPLDESTPKPSPPPPTQGGLPFAPPRPRPRASSSGGLVVVAGGAALTLALAAAVGLSRGGRRRAA